MILRVALALAAAAPALASTADDIRADAKAQLGAEVRAAQAADRARSNTRLASDAQSNSFILGIGDPENYHPYDAACPAAADFQWVRPATGGLSKGETDYLTRRQPGIDAAVAKMVSAAGLPTPPRTPMIGLALSGGGYRAMINGLGLSMALMNGSDEASKAGTGGWFDAVSYMAGLSGGSWATGSFMANNGTLPTDLITNVWNLEQNLVFPSDGKVAFYTNMVGNVNEKKDRGFPTQVTDYWALALGEHLLPDQHRMANGANFTYDQLSSLSRFQDASVPFPIIIAAEREKNITLVATNATVWEFTPYEFGSWAIGFSNMTAGFFTPIEYLGTRLVDGKSNGTCTKGFDQLSFVMGTSSTLFNYAIVQLNATDSDSAVVDLIKDILSDIATDLNDVSQITNPTYQNNYDPTAPNPLHDYEYLTLVDAGETNQNIPLDPLLVRDVDVILAFDNSADTTYSWPNGSAMYTTWERAVAFREQHNIHGLPIPDIPTTNTVVNQGLNTRPVFYGCNLTDTPLVVYVPHYPWSYYSNSSTFKLSYDSAEATAQMESAMRSLTLNGTVPTWPRCLACALTDRAFAYTAQNRSAECAACFNTWCWDGVQNDTAPADDYAPLAGVTPQFLVANNLTTDKRDQPINSGAGGETPQATPNNGAARGGALSAGMVLAAALVGGLAIL